MSRTAALFAALALVVAGVAVPAAGSAPAAGGVAGQEDTSNGPATSDGPGARLAGVVAVQGAEVEGEIADRTFGVRIARANSNGSKAAVVADTVADLEARLGAIEARRRALEEAREDGNLSRARYAAEVAALAARSVSVNRRLDHTAAVARGLPDDALAEKGVDVSAIQALRTRSADLTGPEVAEIARSIAGPGVGRELSTAGNATAGPPADRPSPAGGPPTRGSPDAPDTPDVPGSTEPSSPDSDDANVTVTVDAPTGAGP